MASPRRLSNGRWRAEIMIGGERHSRTFTLKREARDWINQVRTDHARGVFIPPDRQREKVSDRLDVWLDMKAADPNFADTSLYRYKGVVKNHIRPHLGSFTLEHLTVERIEQWRNRMVNDHGPAVAKSALEILSSFLATQERHGYVPRNVAKLVQAPKYTPEERSILEPWELRAAVEQLKGAPCSMPSPNRGSRWSAMPEDHPEWELRSGWAADAALGLAFIGCRVGDFSRLRPEDWDRANDRLFVRDSKTGNDRRLPVFDELREVLLRSVARGGKFLFMADGSRGPSRFNNESFGTRHWHPALDAASVKHVRLHDLRHTCASWLIKKGFGPVHVAAYLGHSNPTTTMRTYAHLFADDFADLGEALDEMWAMSHQQTENVTQIRKAE